MFKKKNAFIALIIISIAIISFYLFLKFRQHCPSQTANEVCVTLLNRSGQSIKELTLSCSAGSIKCNPLLNGNDTTIQYHHSGEGTYQWTIILKNDSIIRSDGNYIEGGYCIVDTVRANDVRSHYCDFLWKN